MKKLITALALLALAACSAPAVDVERVLTDQGFTEISVGGASLFSCGKDDMTSNTFTAKGPTGRPIKGVVCGSGGFFKGYTVRTF